MPRSTPLAVFAKPLLLLSALVLGSTGCWSRPPEGTFGCEVDADCPSGQRCLPGPEDRQLACYKESTSPSTPPDGGEPGDACVGENCASDADLPDPGDGGGTTPADTGTPPVVDAGDAGDAGDANLPPPDAGNDAGTDAATDSGTKPDCGARAPEVGEAKCGDCNVGVKRRQRAWSTETCSWGAWGEYGPCEEKAACKPGMVQRGMTEPCGWCNKGTRTPTRTCSTETCTWGAFSSPPCEHADNICQPLNLKGKGYKCCGNNKWMWCYDSGPANGCTYTGNCETCTQGSNCGC